MGFPGAHSSFVGILTCGTYSLVPIVQSHSRLCLHSPSSMWVTAVSGIKEAGRAYDLRQVCRYGQPLMPQLFSLSQNLGDTSLPNLPCEYRDTGK